MLDPTTGGLRVPPARQLWAPHPAPTEAAAVYSLFQQQEHQHQTLLAAPRFTTPSAATYPCGTAALLASVHPQKDVITSSNYSPITLKPKLAKKRSWDEMVKVEPAPAKSPCSCPNGAKKIETAASSRTTPVSLSLVKKEPIGTPSTPCQVAEVTTSVRVKQEISESSITTGASGIPVGIAVARQRNLDNGRSRGETPPTPAHHAHATPTLAPPTFLQQPPPLLLAGCDDRSMWSMPHTAPHWQYPPMEPSIPVGFQLVRDPMTGQLLLIPPTTNVGVMLPCDMASAAKATHMSSASQPLLASNAGLTLIQQLSTLANPTQFSTGSLLIQHISGSNTVPHTLLPHHSTGSVLISTQQLNTEPTQLINTATAHAQHSTAVMQLGNSAPAATVSHQLTAASQQCHQLTAAAQQCHQLTAAAQQCHQLTESHVTTSTSTTLMTQSHAPAQIVFDQTQQQTAAQIQMQAATVQTPVEQTQPLTQPPQQLTQQSSTPSLNQQPSVNTLSITTTTTTVQQESLAVSADVPAAHVETQSAVVTSPLQGQQADMTSSMLSQQPEMTTPMLSQQPDMTSPMLSQQPEMSTPMLSQQPDMTSPMLSQQTEMTSAIVATVAPVQLHAETQCGSDDNDSQPAIVVEKKSQGTSPVASLNGYSGDEMENTSDCEVADDSQDATFQDAGNQTESLSPAADQGPATPLTTNGDSVDATSCSTVADKLETIGCTTAETSFAGKVETISCKPVETSCSTVADKTVENSCSTSVSKQSTSCSTVEATVDDTMQLNGLELLSYSIEKFAKRSTSATVDDQTDCNQVATEKAAETVNSATVKTEIEMLVLEEGLKERGEAVAVSKIVPEERGEESKDVSGRKFDGLSLLLSAVEHQKDVEPESILKPKKESSAPHRRMMPKYAIKPPRESTSAVCTVSQPFKPTETDDDVRRLIADQPCDKLEQNMRSQLAEIQKQYREKQRELSKLSPNATSSMRRLMRRKRTSRKGSSGKNSSAERRDTSSEKEKSLERLRSASPKAREGDLSPPVLEPWSALPHCSDSRIPPVLTPSSNQLTASAHTPRTPRREWTDDRDLACKSPPTLSPVASSSSLCPPLSSSSHPHSSSSSSSSSSKKRRQMGRPKKRDEHHHHHHHHHHHRDDSPSANVSKKARCSKNALVGLLLGPSAKNRLAQMATAQHSSNANVATTNANSDANKPHKIRPKLKAEVKMKLWCEEEDGMEWTNISEESKMTSPLHMKFAHRRSSVPPENPLASPQQSTPVVSKLSGNGMRRPIKSKSLPGSIIQAKANKLAKEKQQAAPVMHKRKSLPAMPSTSNHKTSDISPKCISTLAELDSVECRLTLATLENEGGLPCRVLVAKGGLLYAGELAEIQAPDLYSITLDGERAHRPHIYTQEEVLNDILLEVKLEMAPMQGTRLCAFWSQQYRCLYPGTVALHTSPHHHDLVCVEFDDGDNGRIPLDDLRLLPKDYPVVEYDPNPLLTLGKRKRRISTASSENSTKTNITAEQALEEIDEEHIDEPDEAMAEEDEPRQGGEDEEDNEDDEEEVDEHHEEETVVNEQERMDVESDEAGEEEQKDGERDSGENGNEFMNRVEEESKDREINNGASGSGESQEANQPTVKALTEEEKERRRLKKKKREKHRMEMERREGGSGSGSGGEHKKKKKHRECCNKPHHHHKHKHHKHRHHKHRHSSADGSETNKEEGDENKMSPPKETDGRQTDRPHSKPLQADATNTKEYKKHRDRQNSVEGGKSKMAAFLPAKQLWQWLGKGYKRPGAKGRCRKEFYKSIHRENETISVGDCAVFLSTGRPDRPFIGRIESMWSSWTHNMVVKVKWFYHPEETSGCPDKLAYPGALFESPHNDENDVQTISHKCEVLSLDAYKNWLSRDPDRVETIYDYNDIYYLAGYYDPTTLNLTFEPGVN